MTYARILLISLLCLSLSALSFASGSGHSHGHDDKESSGKVVTEQVKPGHLQIDTKIINGVKARINVVALEQIQKEGDKLFTHKIAATFIDNKSGKVISDGSVALRFTDDHEATGNFINLPPTDNGFATYLFLPAKGEQHMMLAARLNKEKVRQFHFHFYVK